MPEPACPHANVRDFRDTDRGHRKCLDCGMLIGEQKTLAEVLAEWAFAEHFPGVLPLWSDDPHATAAMTEARASLRESYLRKATPVADVALAHLASERVVEAVAKGIHEHQEYATCWDDEQAGSLSRKGTILRPLGEHGRSFYRALARAALTAQGEVLGGEGE